MLDKLEHKIAKELSDHHFYPFAEHNYLKIFNAFSFFPINFKDIGINEAGKSVTFLALVIYYCFKNRKSSFDETYNYILKELQSKVQEFYPQDVVVETYLGCILYFYHPTSIKSKLSSTNISKLFNDAQKYEYNMKKKTILIYAI